MPKEKIYSKTEIVKELNGKNHVIYNKEGSNKMYVKHKGLYLPWSDFKDMQRIKIGGYNECPIGTLGKIMYSNKFRHLFFGRDAWKCFLKGTFVFEDKGYELFKKMLPCNPKNQPFRTTHQEIKKKPLIRCSAKIEASGKNKGQFQKYCFKDNSKINLYQYEIQLKPKIEIACNNRKETKGTILMYHFSTDNNSHEYTLVKFINPSPKSILSKYLFGTSPKNELGNIRERMEDVKFQLKEFKNPKAFGIFTSRPTPIDFKQKPLTRREDCHKNKDGCYYKNMNVFYNDPPIQFLKNFLKKPEEIRTLEQNINFYEQYVRTGDELFIPQALTNILLYNLEKHQNYV